MDKYECLTVDTTRVSETRRWGAEPRQDREESEAKRAAPGTEGPGTAAWGGPLGILMKLTGRGVKRSREEASNGSSGGGGGGGGGVVERAPRAPENPWQAGRLD